MQLPKLAMIMPQQMMQREQEVHLGQLQKPQDAVDEHSSIIIDTKVTNGVPVLSREQRDDFIKNMGYEKSDGERSKLAGEAKFDMKLNPTAQVVKSIFDSVKLGNVEELKLECKR